MYVFQSKIRLKPLVIIYAMLGGLLSILTQIHSVYAHGGIPRVLEIQPQTNALWVIDTLGFFRSPWIIDSDTQQITVAPNRIDQQNWQWLCDDAVDIQSGISQATLIASQNNQMSSTMNTETVDYTLLAVARSGLYQSLDQGCSFEQVNGELSEHVVGGLFPHPQRSQEVLAITQTLGKKNDVYLSEDAGQSWNATGLDIEGMLYQLWRSPTQSEQMWLHHAEGLSYSEDGGRIWNQLELQAGELMLRPRELSLLGGGIDDLGRVRLFMSVNRFPESLLLTSIDQGRSWQQIHAVNDSYDALVFIDNHILVATPFEGLFMYQITANTDNEAMVWQNTWNRDDSTFVDCLVHDTQGRIWACGRSAPTDWLIAYSESYGINWQPFLNDYQQIDAQQTEWGCTADSYSIQMCEDRCLGIDCDPSGLDMLAGEMAIAGMEIDNMMEGSEVIETEEVTAEQMMNPVTSPNSEEGCHQLTINGNSHQYLAQPRQHNSIFYLLCFALFMIMTRPFYAHKIKS
jgi:hypothetical protein